MLRELAQFSCTVGSPISAIEDQQHRMAPQRSKMNGHSALVSQGKIGRRLSCGRGYLRRRQALLGQRAAEKQHKDQESTHKRCHFNCSGNRFNCSALLDYAERTP
jgi:hypothetical protein